jgi:hypothetical protein
MPNLEDDDVPKPEIQEFARILMQRVRDEAIRECDRDLSPDAPSAAARRWRKAAETGSADVLLKEAIPDVVDSAIAQLLYAIDEGWLHLFYKAGNGKVIDLNKGDRGELVGWLGGGPGGWTVTYSKERFVDDFPHADDPYRPFPPRN